MVVTIHNSVEVKIKETVIYTYIKMGKVPQRYKGLGSKKTRKIDIQEIMNERGLHKGY